MSAEIVVLHNGFRLKGFSDEFIDDVKSHLVFSNPKYEQAKKYSKWGAPKSIPRYLKYYRQFGEYLFIPYGFPIKSFLPDYLLSTLGNKLKVKNSVTFSPFKLTLRRSQQEAYDAYFSSLEKFDNHGQIVMNTGKGKTVTALAIAARLSVRTLVIVHKSDLLKVWAEDIALALEMPIGIIQGSTRNIDDITIATVQTLNSMKKSGALNKRFLESFDLIIVDEAHHCPASTYSLIDDFKAVYRLGLTATPERNDGLTHVLNLYFGTPCYVYKDNGEDDDILPVKVFIRDVPLRYNPIVELVETGFNGTLLIRLVDEFSTKKISNMKNRPASYFNLSEFRGSKIDFPSDFNRATMERSITNSDETFNTVLKDLESEVLAGKSCLLFFKQKEEVDLWYEKLYAKNTSNKYLFKIAKYYGNNSEDENRYALKEIEAGFYNVTLTTLAKCGEGTNCKAWESVFLISSIANGKDVEQAIGRARRIKRGKSKVVNVYDYRFPRVQGVSLTSHYSARDERYEALNFDYPRKKDNKIFSFGYISK